MPDRSCRCPNFRDGSGERDLNSLAVLPIRPRLCSIFGAFFCDVGFPLGLVIRIYDRLKYAAAQRSHLGSYMTCFSGGTMDGWYFMRLRDLGASPVGL